MRLKFELTGKVIGTLPGFDWTRLNMEQWVAFWSTDCAPLLVRGRTANRQLAKQMVPLVLDLTDRHKNGFLNSRAANFAAVERIAACYCLGINALQVATDCRARPGQSAKAVKLRMMSIPACSSSKYGSGQQRFSPQRDQALGIEVLRMQRPEPHLRRLALWPSGATGLHHG